jgi:sugar lactone lactonase YvrE
LRWVDLDRGAVLSLSGGGTLDTSTVERIETPSAVAGFIRPRTGGGWVVSTERGLAFAEDVDEVPSELLELWTDPGIRSNDGGVAPDGSLLVGTIHWDEVPGAATLFRLSTERVLSTLIRDVTVSNGVDFTVDGSLGYYADSPTRTIDRIILDGGTLVSREPFVTLAEGAGYPDGLTVDADGNVWVACWAGSAVHAYSSAGELIEVIELPATQVTACTFGGDDLSTLFITTSRRDQPDQPEAGALFAVETGYRGQPVRPYAG